MSKPLVSGVQSEVRLPQANHSLGVPQVSVITPTRSRTRLLAEAIESVREQTLDSWEHLIVDDGPDEETARLVEDRANLDRRVRYLARQGPVAGANVCRNLGLAEARGRFVVFLDDDDRLAPECLAQRVAVMRQNLDLDFAVFAAEIFEEQPGDLGLPYQNLDAADDLLRFLSLDCPWQTTGPIWRRAYLLALGGFTADLLSMQDLELHVRALCARPSYLVRQTADHFIRAVHDASRTSTRHFHDPVFIDRSESIPGLLARHVERAGLSSWSRCRALLGLRFGTAERWAAAGDPAAAFRSWRKACRETNASPLVSLPGYAMLCLAGFDPQRRGLAARIVNKWKGAVRFRQEPALSPPRDDGHCG